jgi:hypothetical protein
MPRHLWNQKAYSSVHVLTTAWHRNLSWEKINPVHILAPYFIEIRFSRMISERLTGMDVEGSSRYLIWDTRNISAFAWRRRRNTKSLSQDAMSPGRYLILGLSLIRKSADIFDSDVRITITRSYFSSSRTFRIKNSRNKIWEIDRVVK